MSRRFGRQQKRKLKAEIKRLEKKCDNLMVSNDAFIKERRAFYRAINIYLSGERISLIMRYIQKRTGQ